MDRPVVYVIGGVAVSLALLFGGYRMGLSAKQAEWDAALLIDTEEIIRKAVEGAQAGFLAGLALSKDSEKVRYVVKEVIREVEKIDTASCPVLPADFGRLYNEAVGGTAAGSGLAAGRSDGGGAGTVPASGAARR